MGRDRRGFIGFFRVGILVFGAGLVILIIHAGRLIGKVNEALTENPALLGGGKAPPRWRNELRWDQQIAAGFGFNRVGAQPFGPFQRRIQNTQEFAALRHDRRIMLLAPVNHTRDWPLATRWPLDSHHVQWEIASNPSQIGK